MQCCIDVTVSDVHSCCASKPAFMQVQNGASEVEASLRVANNDRPNAYLVDATKDRADLILPRLPLEHA